MGIGTLQKLTKEKIIPNYSLIFKDNTKLDVKKVGQNSAYFFYFIPGEKVMKADSNRPSAEEIIQYEKDPATKIATITLNRPDKLNAPTVAARQRYAALVHRANVDDDVKILIIRGVGKHLGSGADLEESADMFTDNTSYSPLYEFGIGDHEDVKYPPKDSYRYLSSLTHLYANSDYGLRSLQDFKKISIDFCRSCPF